MDILKDATGTFSLTQSVDVIVTKSLPFYGTIEGANAYFYLHEKFHIWDGLQPDDKLRYLISASRRIDRLNYAGQKAAEGQILEFPRTGSVIVPTVIEQAAFELALRLGDGIDPDIEADNLSVTSQGYGAARTTFDRTFVPDYVRAGIPSQTAWLLLFPYLRNPNDIKLSRSS